MTTREGLGERLASVIRGMKPVLVEGVRATILGGNLLELEQTMWTFARVEGVESTIERLHHPAVLWQ